MKGSHILFQSVIISCISSTYFSVNCAYIEFKWMKRFIVNILPGWMDTNTQHLDNTYR